MGLARGTADEACLQLRSLLRGRLSPSILIERTMLAWLAWLHCKVVSCLGAATPGKTASGDVHHPTCAVVLPSRAAASR